MDWRRRLGGNKSKAIDVDLTTRVGSVTLSSPVMTAAGTSGHGTELADFFDLSSIGAIVVKSMAPYEWPGNPPLRVAETPAGMINSVGLQGPGIEAWLEIDLPALVDTGATVVASIWGRTVSDYRVAAEMLANAPDAVVAVEVNISCPNTEAGNELFAHSPELTAEVLAATAGCNRPRWAKLSPNAGPALPTIAAAAVEGGAEALTLVNTFFGLRVDIETRRPVLGNGAGGVSGPAIKPMALKAVADVRSHLPEVPIVGVGGIARVEDVVEYALVGASAIQIGTATFAEPRTCDKIQQGLVQWCARNQLLAFSELVNARER